MLSKQPKLQQKIEQHFILYMVRFWGPHWRQSIFIAQDLPTRSIERRERTSILNDRLGWQGQQRRTTWFEQCVGGDNKMKGSITNIQHVHERQPTVAGATPASTNPCDRAKHRKHVETRGQHGSSSGGCTNMCSQKQHVIHMHNGASHKIKRLPHTHSHM